MTQTTSNQALLNPKLKSVSCESRAGELAPARLFRYPRQVVVK
ncbi:hypothetical protein AALB_1421 [Agarivorans albus MKT 106]|uniref:Uncharacterized protein n=1 Tax=Agarivorans albus MKT 106 TaxID=1331007 RepID=R9PSV7_AGAAL|nr:hypothetical protein AALB_1421 [Agarivorans albus MKT 106]